MLLSILICSIQERQNLLLELENKLKRQNKYDDVEVCIYTDSKQNSVGTKRNSLMSMARGKYICFIDDDDDICDDYITIIRNGCLTDSDCVSLIGQITFNGKDPRTFIHSIEYNSYFEENNIYYRPPNHLNTIKKELIESIKFPDINCGEDTDWAMQICNAGLLKTEYKVDKTLYYYLYDTEKTATQK